jgi:tetratricopeptide (TPR) repeat protein
MKKSVKIWEAPHTIPTYRLFPPEKCPLFIEKRAYQGSTGKVYPLPITEKISDTKTNVVYQAVFLENEYLKVMVLPELGGRIQRAYDKTNDYGFIYYNHVIKPALVGLTGPWISGGIEFNWPQHHRPSTFSPVDYTLSENSDGSCTVHVSETDKMYGSKGMASITLYPDKAYIEIKGQLYNPTDLPQTFLWWANPAVPVNNNTFSVFPPDVNAVMDHGKRAVSTFPIATGEYYKQDYSAGVDISRYKNIKVPTSYMAAHSDYDFIGNYDESLQAGLLHVSDHHVSPGKKQWTWGNGDFGQTWDRNLTDEDGPYIELMTGVFTDNQPDFTWLKPQEEKTFVQYFMPYKGVGHVGNATKDAVISLSKQSDAQLLIKVYVTGIHNNATIRVIDGDNIIFEKNADLSPQECYEVYIPLPENLNTCRFKVLSDKKILVSHSVYVEELKPIPEPAQLLPDPVNLKSLEELYLAAQHLEQYRHATYEPADYYLEGLKRDASDIRLNNGYGLLLFKRGQIRESIPFFKKAIEKQTWKTPNPYHGECYFNLGLAYYTIGEDEKAFDAFYKSTWSAEMQSAGFYRLASLSVKKGDLVEALNFISLSMIRNWHNMKARTLKAAILRLLGHDNEALITESLQIDPLYMGCLYEKALSENSMKSWKAKMREEAHNYLELALDYIKSGLYPDALCILEACEGTSPLLFYYIGYVHFKTKNDEEAIRNFKTGEAANPDYCFPNRIEEIEILSTAIQILDQAAMAHYYLGNLYYDKKQYQLATNHWNTAVDENSKLAMAWRNLSISYYNKQNDGKKALAAMEQACTLDPDYPRFCLEHDQLSAKMNASLTDRLQSLEAHKELLKSRDDLFLRYITLLNCIGNYEDAYHALMDHRFHPWEGGEGKVSLQYRYALIHKAIIELEADRPEKALEFLFAALNYPENLGEGKLPNVPDNQAYYYIGLSYRQLNDTVNMEKYLTLATCGEQEPCSAIYYNEQPSDFIYYQGLAYETLGQNDRAKRAFHKLISYGEKHIFDHVTYDYFAVSLPEIEVYQEDLQLRNSTYCNYLMALGYLGLGNKDKANELFSEILSKQADYQGALEHLVCPNI